MSESLVERCTFLMTWAFLPADATEKRIRRWLFRPAWHFGLAGDLPVAGGSDMASACRCRCKIAGRHRDRGAGADAAFRRSLSMIAGLSLKAPQPEGGMSGGGRWPALAALAIGILLLATLWLGPLPGMARRAFSPHMILHLGVTVAAAPLIALGLVRLGRERAVRHPMALALGASLFEMVVVWGWHAPVLHEAAAARFPAFVAQQASFFAAGLLIWAVAFAGNTRAMAGVGVFAMLFTFMHMAMLGLLLSLAPDLLYAPAFCLGAWGFAPLDDQRLGGALMAVFGGLPYLAGGLALTWRMLAE
jgi:putative membrane protein